MKSINLLYFSLIGFCLTAALTMPSTITPVSPNQLVETSQNEGEVKGKQTQDNLQSSQPQEMSNEKSDNVDLGHDDNLPLKIDKPSAKLNKSESSTSPLPKKETKINLLVEPVQLIDQSLSIPLSSNSQLSEGPWLLQITTDLATEEELIGFDRPGFTISFDQKLVLQRTAQEIRKNKNSAKSEQIFSFNFSQLDQLPNELTIWAGNEGDQLQPTSVVVKAVNLEQKNVKQELQQSINDLQLFRDQEYLTLIWTGSDSCLTQMRWADQPITKENWLESKQLENIHGNQTCALVVGENNLLLSKKPPVEHGYLVLVLVDQLGRLKALSNSINF